MSERKPTLYHSIALAHRVKCKPTLFLSEVIDASFLGQAGSSKAMS